MQDVLVREFGYEPLSMCVGELIRPLKYRRLGPSKVAIGSARNKLRPLLFGPLTKMTAIAMGVAGDAMARKRA